MRVVGDGVRDRAEQQRADAGVAPRAHHDEHRVVRVGGVDDGLRDAVMRLDSDRRRREAGIARSLAAVGGERLGRLLTSSSSTRGTPESTE